MICDLLTQSWETIGSFDPRKFVVLFGIAPIEEHGKHLPIGVDVYETQVWLEKAVSKQDREQPEMCWGILPPIPLGFADMGVFPGNIHVSRGLLFDVTYQTLAEIAKWG